MNEILTAQEVAAMLRISTRQVYELAKGGARQEKRPDSEIESSRSVNRS
jgi:hypothetical protein